MRRLGRWLLNAIIALLLLLAVGSCALWEVSFWRYDTLTVGWNGRPGAEGLASGWVVRLMSNHGGLELVMGRVLDGNAGCYRWAERVRDDRPRLTLGRARFYAAGWGYRGRARRRLPMIDHGGDVYAPYRVADNFARRVSVRWVRLSDGLLAALLAAIPAVRVWRAIRRRRQPGPGCCPHCGYDLTGNVSGVCPECGRAAAVALESRGGDSVPSIGR